MRCRFISLLLVLCPLLAGAQAFTPMRPFVRAQSGNGILTPQQLGVAYWWVYTDLNTNNTKVTSWADRINTNTFVTNGIADQQPLATPIGVLFDRTKTQQLSGNVVFASDGPPLHRDSSHWVIVQRNGTTAVQDFLTYGGAVREYGFAVDDRLWATSLAGYLEYDGTPNANKVFDVCITEDAVNTTFTMYTNGVQAMQAAYSPSPYYTWDNFGGSSAYPGGGNRSFSGYILEIGVWSNVVLTASEVANLHMFATNTYTGLVWFSTPNIVSQPQSISCITNSIVSMSVSATGDPFGTLNYRWRTNGVSLSDGTMFSGTSASTLWITNTTTLYTNLPVTCFIDYGGFGSSVTSSVANLTVMPDAITNGLVAWWKLDDGSGVVAADSIGSYTGYLTNSPTWTTGVLSGSLKFDAAQLQYVNVPSSSINLTNITISAWVTYNTNLPPSGTIPRIASNLQSPTYNGYELLLYDTTGGAPRAHTFYLQCMNASAFKTAYAISTTVATNVSYFVVGTYDGTNGYIYVNGVKDTGGADATFSGVNAIGNSSSNIVIGTASGLRQAINSWTGTIDDVRIYNRALTTNEIQTLYQFRY